MRVQAAFALFGFLPVVSLGETTSLKQYLDAHPWDVAANGPMLVLEPERARTKEVPGGITSFGRKKVNLGSVTAIVPRKRIDIDDSLQEAPNMYEGLPNDAKVLYLMRTLNAEQWRKLGTSGLGLGDVKGEQALVLASILPDSLSWEKMQADGKELWGHKIGSGTLSAEECKQVRLKVSREVDFKVYFRESNSYSSISTDRYKGAPGDQYFTRRQGNDEYVRKSAFGVNVRKEVENNLKSSQLNYSAPRFSASLSLPNITTVGKILSEVNRACSVEIIPDFRVAERSVSFYGKQVSAADALKALALSVEGTYRQVGSAYVLTSDLMGMGTRKYKLAYWEEFLTRDTRKRQAAWQLEIGAMAGFKNVGFDPKSDVSPNEDLLKTVEKGDTNSSGEVDVSADQLTPGLRRFLDQWDMEYRLQPIKKDKVGLSSSYHYQYVLPNGAQLMPEGQIGMARSFHPEPPRNQGGPSGIGAMPAMKLPKDAKIALQFQTDNPTEALEAAKALAGLPGAELWIETARASVLESAREGAKSSGVPIGLIVHPWRSYGAEPDLTLALDSGTPVARRVESLAFSSFDKRNYADRVGPWISPDSPKRAEYWKAIQGLSKTAGLSGVIVAESQPFGYEAKREEWQSLFGPLDWATLSHGYTVSERVRFLRKEGVDPIDIGDRGYWTTPDLRQTYFFDDGLRGMPSVYDGTDDTHPKTRTVAATWRSDLAKQNEAAMIELLNGFGGSPIYIEPRVNSINEADRQPTKGFVSWTPGLPLPKVAPYDGSTRIGYFQFLAPDVNDPSWFSLVYQVRAVAANPMLKIRPIIDISKLGPNRLNLAVEKLKSLSSSE